MSHSSSAAASCMLQCIAAMCCSFLFSGRGVVFNNTSWVWIEVRRAGRQQQHQVLKRARPGCGVPAGCPWA
jgi:hypothetical protein